MSTKRNNDLHDQWNSLLSSMTKAGDILQQEIAELDLDTQGDAWRALVRALINQLGRFDVDRQKPELVPYNLWQEKFFMDNPDFLYHVADIDPAGAYRIRGNLGEAAYTSMTVYSASGLADATATSRLDSDAIETDQNGNFEVVISSEQAATTNWLAMPADANSIWIRGFHEDVYRERPGEFVIEPLNEVKPPRWIEPEKLAYRLERLGKGMVGAVKGMIRGAAYDLEHPNEIRVWHEMQGGAVFTEPNIYYQRGSWKLEEDEVLVIEGVVPDCRYWNLMLYSRFLNSLDHRHRNISLTGSRAEVGEDGSFRMVLSSEDPGLRNWVDTEGRPFGMFVFRWLQPTEEPALPKVRVVKKERLGELS